jgi:repressor LexA
MTPKTLPGKTRDRVYNFVQRRLLEGAPPTVREVQTALGFRAVQTAREHLERLVAEGRLAKRKGKARGYRLPLRAGAEPASRLVPLLGRVQAGGLTTATEDLEGYIPVQTRGPGDLFALRVQGESMTGAGIFARDIVVVRAQPSAQSGDIVVALVEDEATVKTLRIRRGRLELHPQNPAFDPIVPAPGACKILGKVIEARRHIESPEE